MAFWYKTGSFSGAEKRAGRRDGEGRIGETGSADMRHKAIHGVCVEDHVGQDDRR